VPCLSAFLPFSLPSCTSYLCLSDILYLLLLWRRTLVPADGMLSAYFPTLLPLPLLTSFCGGKAFVAAKSTWWAAVLRGSLMGITGRKMEGSISAPCVRLEAGKVSVVSLGEVCAAAVVPTCWWYASGEEGGVYCDEPGVGRGRCSGHSHMVPTYSVSS